MSKIQSYIEATEKSLDRIVELSSSLSEETIQWKPSETAWSVQEILAHVVEAGMYWVNEVLNIVNKTSEQWGRTLADEARLAAVARAQTVSTAELLEGVRQSKGQIREALSKLKDEDLQIEAPSRNPKFGVKPLSFILEHQLVEHMETHAKQIERNISQHA